MPSRYRRWLPWLAACAAVTLASCTPRGADRAPSSAPVPAASPVSVASVSLVGPGHAWVSLEDGRVLHTADAGRAWHQRGRLPGGAWLDFVNPDVGWALWAGPLLRTQDGGRTWTLVAEARVGPHPEPWEGTDSPGGLSMGDYVSALSFLDARHGWHGTRRLGGLWSTADGGVTWRPVPLPPPAAAGGRAVVDVDFASPRRGCVVVEEAAGERLLVTHDGGQAWEERRFAGP